MRGCDPGLRLDALSCEHCKTLYLPNPGEAVLNVAGQGRISVFGLTLPPKEEKKS